ncbi:MAG: hypothetical protein VKL39_06250 [Leptolyngbyaceae bacterium]|nr:hypothetical protein [Leptolyngbyaceae bacterium]
MTQPQIWWRLRRSPIQQKVAWGYGLSLGIAIVGTILGIVFADQQQWKADTIAADTREELGLFTRLKGEALQTFVAQQQFKRSLANCQDLPTQYAKWQSVNRQFQQVWEEFETSEGATASLTWRR